MTKSEAAKLESLVREMFDREQEWVATASANERALAFGRLRSAKDKLKEVVRWTPSSTRR